MRGERQYHAQDLWKKEWLHISRLALCTNEYMYAEAVGAGRKHTVVFVIAFEKGSHSVVPELNGAIVKSSKDPGAFWVKSDSFDAIAFRLELDVDDGENQEVRRLLALRCCCMMMVMVGWGSACFRGRKGEEGSGYLCKHLHGIGFVLR